MLLCVRVLKLGAVMRSMMLSQASSIFLVNSLLTNTGVSATLNSIAPGCLLWRSFKKSSYFSFVKASLKALRNAGIMQLYLFFGRYAMKTLQQQTAFIFFP